MSTAFEKPDFTLFLHALASEFDEQAGPAARDVLLRSVGRRMASRMLPPSCRTMEALEIEINDLLGQLGWGRMQLDLLSEERALRITHEALPRLGSLGEPTGEWLSATLEGMYEGWLSNQPDAHGPYDVLREDPCHSANGNPVIILKMRSVEE